MNVKGIIAIGLLSAGLASCGKGGEESGAGGTGYLRITASPKAVPVVSAVSASAGTKAVGTDNFIIRIRETESGKQVFKSDYSQLPYIIALRNTNHIIEAVSLDEVPAAAFDAPYYAGQVPIYIEKNVCREVDEIRCAQDNVKVTVSCTDGLKAEFLDYTVTVSNGSGQLAFVRDEGRAGYFTVAPLRVTFAGTYRVNDMPIEYSFDINAVEKAEWHRINLDVTYDENGTRSAARSAGVSGPRVVFRDAVHTVR